MIVAPTKSAEPNTAALERFVRRYQEAGAAKVRGSIAGPRAVLARRFDGGHGETMHAVCSSTWSDPARSAADARTARGTRRPLVKPTALAPIACGFQGQPSTGSSPFGPSAHRPGAH